jgi:hypothetical protein
VAGGALSRRRPPRYSRSVAWEFHVLVVANVTATSEELLQALRLRAERDACRFTLLMPRAGPGTEQQLAEAIHTMGQAGVKNLSGRLGDPDPVVAAIEVWDPREFDEIIVSTLPTGVSRWLGLDLPRRLAKLTSVGVQHVVAQPRLDLHWESPQQREDYGVLSPLAAVITRR